VHHADIDKEKWDRCIDNAVNGLIYGYSYYLDIMSPDWDALIMGDYEIVMPLTWNRKFGITYLRQPAFTQQLGIFASLFIKDDLTKAFLKKALEEFSFAEINLNYGNEYNQATVAWPNRILPLNRPFIQIEKKFRKDFVKKIKCNNLVYDTDDNVEKVISLFIKNYSSRIHAAPQDYKNILQLSLLLKKKKKLFIRKVSDPNGQLLSIAIFLKDKRRIYYVMSITLPEGRKKESNYFLLYYVVKEFSDQNLIFDFEGSAIPSIQLFFKKFGSIEQSFPVVRINHLPFFIKGVKQIYDYFKFGNQKNNF
jgi:hypothetical protein